MKGEGDGRTKNYEVRTQRGGLMAAVTVIKEEFLELFLRHGHQLIQRQTALLIPAHILAHGVTREMKSTRNAFYTHSNGVTSQ